MCQCHRGQLGHIINAYLYILCLFQLNQLKLLCHTDTVTFEISIHTKIKGKNQSSTLPPRHSDTVTFEINTNCKKKERTMHLATVSQ